jgi:uncharacterized protein YbaP (TraB family)
MIKPLSQALLVLALASPAFAQSEAAAQPPVPASVEDAPEDRVVVVGQRPGPGLWKISKGDNVLWLFGTYAPLPKNMTWRSHQVETILVQSQEAIAPPSAKPKLGILKMLSLAPHVMGLANNPDGARLKDILSPDVYARWEVLRKKYLPDADMERVRPLFAASALYSAGLEKAGLTTKQEVSRTVGQLIKKSGVKLTRVTHEFAVDDPSAAVKIYKRSALDDAACLSKTMDQLEMDIDVMKARANAWSKGDLAAMRKLDFADREGACKDAMMRSPAMRSVMKVDEIEAQLQVNWLAAVEKALASNASTFAVLSINRILEPKGVLAILQAKGYQVDSPD